MKDVGGKERVRILSEALPFIRRYHGKVVAVKIGGSVLVEKKLLAAFSRDVNLLVMVGVRIVVIHGGGPQIALQLGEAGIAERKHKGLRITDAPTMQIVAEALSGVNRSIVAALGAQGVTAVGYAGADNRLLLAERYPVQEVDYGLVGTVRKVAADQILDVLQDNVAVIAPLGADADGELLNINADEAAAAIAAKCKAKALLMLTDTDGVADRSGKLVGELSAAQLHELVTDGTVHAGMEPKVFHALSALEQGVGSCRIINGTSEHPLLLDLLTDQGVGTMIIP